MGELENALPPERFRTLLTIIRDRALAVLQGWAGATRIELAVYGNTGERIL